MKLLVFLDFTFYFYHYFCFRFFVSLLLFFLFGFSHFYLYENAGEHECEFCALFCAFISTIVVRYSFGVRYIFFFFLNSFLFSYTNERWYPCHPLTKRHRKSGTQYMFRPVLHALCFMSAVLCGFFARFPVVW